MSYLVKGEKQLVQTCILYMTIFQIFDDKFNFNFVKHIFFIIIKESHKPSILVTWSLPQILNNCCYKKIN